MIHFQDKVSFIWSIAEILRGPYKPEDYGKVVLPLAVLRRFDCVLESTKEEVLTSSEKFKHLNEDAREPILNRIAKQNFHNISQYDFSKLLSDADNIADNLRDYINGFSKTARDIMENFEFDRQIDKLDSNNLLYLTIKRFSELDLHPDVVSNVEMGYIFEELIRRFSEHAEAGDHYTPREVIRLMVNLLFLDDDDILTKHGVTQSLYDCAAGTGGMGSVASEYLEKLNPTADLKFFAQEINPESYAICKADTLIKGGDAKNIKLGNTLFNDQFPSEKFDYLITNPPYGVDWKSYEKPIKTEHETLGFAGRFGPGTPCTSDGQLLFLLHLISKMKPVTEENPNGSRHAIIMNGSPLFTGDAGSGESEIRRYVLENDLVEGIVALPNDLFYNTGIATYIWILTNNKASHRRGKVQLVNVVDFYKKMKKSLGNKRNEITDEQIEEIVRLYGDFKKGEYVKIFDNEDFGYQKITVERPLRLNFKIDEERIARVTEQKAFQNLATSKKKGENGLAEIEKGKQTQAKIIEVLQSLASEEVYKNREDITKMLKEVFKQAGLTISTPVLKGILAGLSEKDETADICMKNKTEPEPDPDLRDTENVPLRENIYTYPTGRILGAQAIGKGNVDKRIDVIATMITMNGTLEDLKDLELTYSPMLGTARDVVNHAAMVALNLLHGVYREVKVSEVRKLVEGNAFIIDAREKSEYNAGHLKNAINIPLSEFRERVDEIPKDRPVYIHCRSGQRSYNMVMALQHLGYTNVYNISGSYLGISLYEYYNDLVTGREKIVTEYNFK